MIRSADVEGQYRYSLARTCRELYDGEHAAEDVCWIMLNPSTADDSEDDRTICRCIAFSKEWGYGGLVVVNLFAFRSTDPKALARVDDPIGPRNDTSIVQACRASSLVVCAWGNGGSLMGRGNLVRSMLARTPWHPMALGVNRTGEPVHPLYQPLSRALVVLELPR